MRTWESTVTMQQMQAQLNGISERLTAAEKKEEPAE